MKIPPLLARTLAIGGVAFALLLPIAMISGKVAERQARANAVVAQFAAETTGMQVVAGPFLALTCEETFIDERVIKRQGKEETIAERKTQACATGYFPARSLKVSADIPVETRHRGIYDVRLFHAAMEMSGELEWPAPAPFDGMRQRVWKKAYAVVYVADPRGIKTAQSSFSSLAQPVTDPDLGESFALQEALGDYAARRKGDIVPFGYRLRLDGTSSFHVAMTGDASEVNVRSTWPHPSFAGSRSPDTRDVRPGGFEASWRTTSLATGGQQHWEGLVKKKSLGSLAGAAGVTLFEPVNVYTLSYRATEYAFLFILFTFAALALVETLARVRLHAIQYALVGSAIAVFFLLLLAVSEHAPFTSAYAGAASACTILMTAYLRHPLKSLPRTMAFGALFSGIYTILYVLLLREDDALLAGSLMVFALLAIAMLATRKVDWSKFGRVPPAGGGMMGLPPTPQ